VGKRIIAIEAPQPYLAITWQVNNFCNFKCSYCNPGNWAGENPNNGNLDLYIKNLEIIINRYKEVGYKHFKFFFSGGEPTAWRNFIPICEWIHTELPRATLAVNTNLSRPLAWWEKHHHLFDDIVASFHVEFANKERYTENSIYLCDKVNYLSSKMLMHEQRFWEVVEFGNYLKTVMPNYFIEWTPLYDELSHVTGPWKYKDILKEDFFRTHNIEIHQTLPKPSKRTTMTVSYNRYDDDSTSFCNANELIVNGQNFFNGWKCNVGDCIFINPVGEVSLASCGLGGRVGHILDDITKVGPKQITCSKDMCMCGTDIIIPKFEVDK
jgi:organic radical activating enzyme